MYNLDWNTNRGWICGSCGRSFAPHISECPYCNAERNTFASTDVKVDDSEWWKKYLKQTTTDCPSIEGENYE